MVDLCVSLGSNSANSLKQDLVDCDLISVEELAAEQNTFAGNEEH